MENKILTHRFIARIVLQAETGLFVGSGNSSLTKDALVQKDHNGLPMIQGTSLTGALRHSFEDYLPEGENLNSVFGYHVANDGEGSRLQISSAYMLINENKIAEGMAPIIPESIISRYNNLPVRQHVRISEKGVAIKNGLFDNEVVYKGTRFIFEMELRGTADDTTVWQGLIEKINSPLFRIGQGTRNGYGQLKAIPLLNEVYELTDIDHFNSYLEFDPSLNSKSYTVDFDKIGYSKSILEYRLELKPDHFFIFSDGYCDAIVNNKPLMEEEAFYRNSTIEFEPQTLIPASSIKGAISHRTCFHYNKLWDRYIDYGEGKIGIANDAVREIFGQEADNDSGSKGNMIMDDIYFLKNEIDNNKIFNHVAIDRFTGGAMDGALFSEKVSFLLEDKQLNLVIYLTKTNFSEKVLEAFEEALKDICKGLLPLGGMATKGHGIFTGCLIKNEIKIFDYDEPITESIDNTQTALQL